MSGIESGQLKVNVHELEQFLTLLNGYIGDVQSLSDLGEKVFNQALQATGDDSLIPNYQYWQRLSQKILDMVATELEPSSRNVATKLMELQGLR